MKQSRLKYDHKLMDEDTLVSLVMLVPGEMLRRQVARCVWFDVVDQLEKGQHMHRLKAIADTDRLDDEMDFSEEEMAAAMTVVGYEDYQIGPRMRIHHEQRARLERGLVQCEAKRVLNDEYHTGPRALYWLGHHG
jgi:hypothetical protein